MSLLQYVLDESGTWCCTSTSRDWKTITRRVEHEGLSFLTISLPNFGKDFERCLDQGYVDPSCFLGYKRQGELPQFLGGFLDLVFDRSTGILLDTPAPMSDANASFITAIRCIRQICYMFGKLEDDCSDTRVRRAINGYIQTDKDIVLSDATFQVGPYSDSEAGILLTDDILTVWDTVWLIRRQSRQWIHNAQTSLGSHS